MENPRKPYDPETAETTLSEAIRAMSRDSDQRWHAVASLLAGGGPLAQARLAPYDTHRGHGWNELPLGLDVAHAYLTD